MVDIRRSEDNGFDAINIPTQDAIDIAHAILELTDE